MSPSHPRTSLHPSLSAAPVSSGSQTITQQANPTLRLRAEDTPTPSASTPSSSSNRRHIQWDESVIDNEGMGKKSSKVCCIYHKPHEPGDSESESSSDSDSDSDSGGEDLSRARRAGDWRGRRKGSGKGKNEEGDGCGGRDGEGGEGKGKQRKASPNAYERQPKVKAKKEG